MTAANYAGLSRIPLTIAGTFLLLEMPDEGRRLAAVVVAMAIVTDFLDGFLARRLGTVSTFGAIVDLTTDKVFLIPMVFLATRHDATLLWMSVLIAIRDLLLMGLRVYATTAAAARFGTPLGKWKGILLYPALVFVLLELAVGAWLLALATAVALVSAVEELRRAWPLLAPALNARAPAAAPVSTLSREAP